MADAMKLRCSRLLAKVVVVMPALAGCAPTLAQRPSAGPPAECQLLAEAEPGELRDVARYEDRLPLNLGGVWFEVAGELDVSEVLAKEGVVEVTSVRCHSGRRVVWIPGVSHPDDVAAWLVERGKTEGRPIEVVKWVGIGASAALTRLRQRCRDAAACARIAEGASPDVRCHALTWLSDRWSFEACARLPPSKTACGVRALGSQDPDSKRACLEALTADP
jgi:hypothetical protein